VFLHKGLFETTLPSYNGAPIAFAHIDCDWYDPVRYCLREVGERLSPGGGIILDDYHDYGGCRQATDEFLAANCEFELREGANVLLIKRAVTTRPSASGCAHDFL
jgi:O-methyltransferase